MQDSKATNKKVVKTQIPAYQKQDWKDHAQELDMTLSEYLRCMVQRGRTAYAMDNLEDASKDTNPRGNNAKDRLLDILQVDTPVRFEQIIESYATNIEIEVEDALIELADEERIHQTPRGGWIKIEGND